MSKKGELNRIVFGSDAPTGQASLPGAINRAIVKASALNGIPAELCIAMATGNSADLYRQNTGKIEVGCEADLQVIDCPPGSCGKDALKAIEGGDPFGCDLVIVDGRVMAFRGRDSRPTARCCLLDGKPFFAEGITEHLFFPPQVSRHYEGLGTASSIRVLLTRTTISARRSPAICRRCRKWSCSRGWSHYMRSGVVWMRTAFMTVRSSALAS